jgi:hypothetical protein
VADDTEQDKTDHVVPERANLKFPDGFVWTNEVVAQAGLESGRSFAVQGNDTSGYVGVSPEYRTYGNDIDKPLMTEADYAQLKELGIHTDQEMADARLSNALAGNAPGVLMANDPTARGVKADEESPETKGDASTESTVKEDVGDDSSLTTKL